MATECPDCGRLMARNAADVSKGACPKWWAIYDKEAQKDCDHFASNKIEMLEATNLFHRAYAEARKAMRKYPQPNYVITKVAEEAGEVVKAAVHCAEGRETPENVTSEIVQAMAMLIRLYVEGDQVHGMPPLRKVMSE